MPEHSNKLYSAILVVAQFILIGTMSVLALPPSSDSMLIPAALLIVVAVVLALAAILTLKMLNFSVMPEPVRNGKLVTSGPYQYIRHPMYTAVLFGCAGLFLLNSSLISALSLLALYVVLVLKIHREEILLNIAYSNYANYRDQTGALLPRFLRKNK